MPAILLRALLVGLVVCLPLRASADEAPAATVIARLNASLLDTLKNGEQLGYEGRVKKMAPAIDAAFDVPFMAEKSIGKYWAPLSDADKARWVALFREFSAANYAGNLTHYSGQRFEITGQESGQNDTEVVHTMLYDPGGEDTELNYRLHDTPNGPKVIDVYLKGTVSELALRRSDYTSTLERDGFEGLVTTVRTKIADLAAGRGARKSG
jgi:phospholipid transport system substrate-binding protein